MKNEFIYLKSISSNSNDYIQIDITLANEVVPTSEFIDNYIISNYWSGKFFIKKLIKRLFKHKINQQFIWDNKFFDKMSITKFNYKYSLPQTVPDLIQLEKKIKETTTTKRFKDILKYKQLLENKVDLNMPLFITGKALNYLGSDIKSNEIHFLDGTRRLWANILNENINDNGLLINIK